VAALMLGRTMLGRTPLLLLLFPRPLPYLLLQRMMQLLL
jgi:hypothetical protein